MSFLKRFKISLLPLLWFGAILNAFALALAFSVYVRARITLGYWPSYGNPDPKYLNFGLHYSASGYSIAAIFWYMFVAILPIIWHFRIWTSRRFFLPFGLYALGLTFSYYLLTNSNFLDWLLD